MQPVPQPSTMVPGARLTALLLGLASLLLYSINLDQSPHHDEFYHLLAAEGLMATGEPAIGAEGRYWRGYPLTWLVAQSFTLFGQSLAAARLPSVLCMAILVGLLFLFLRREAGVLAAWLGAGLFAVSPFAIDLAQFVRFYSLQCLAFFGGAWLIYAAAQRPWSVRRQLLLLGPAVLVLGFAAYLQPTTLLGLVGLGLWGGGALLLPWLDDAGGSGRRKILAVLGLLLVAAGLWASGILDALWQDYRATPLFNRAHADEFWFYHAWYSLLYPTLWTLVGILATLALIARPKPAGFVLVVFGVGFLLNSFAASKSLRYIAYAQPFLFALWGIGLAVLLEGAGPRIARLRDGLTESFAPLFRALARSSANLFVGGAVLFLLLANPAWLRSLTLLAGITVPPELPPTRWLAAAPALEPWLETVDVLVTTDELGMLYYYGRADYLLSATKFDELPAARRQPFGRDVRTDVPVIRDAASLELIMTCHASGLFISQIQHWVGGARARSEILAAAPLLESQGRPLELPERSRLVAFVWDSASTGPLPEICAALPE